MEPYFTITRKIGLGYLVIVIFSLLSIGYALINLHEHNLKTEQLVGGQFRAFTLLRDIRQNLLADNNLTQQILILRDPQLVLLLKRRLGELDSSLMAIKTAPLPYYFKTLPEAIEEYRDQTQALLQIFASEEWKRAQKMATTTINPLGTQLLEHLAGLRTQHQTTLDNELRNLSQQSSRAYRFTLLITLIGILLSAPAAATVIVNIGRSVKLLKKATHDIAAGSFDTPIDIRSHDEFGQLAQDFSLMAAKLRDFEQLNLDANPLTRLPGNLAIDRELHQRIDQQIPFAHLYIDLDNFKAYGDHYGYQFGSDAIHLVGKLLRQVVDRYGSKHDLVGHIGGDDYLVLTEPDLGEKIAQEIISAFDQSIPELYSEEDFAAGFIEGVDRHGIKRTFPLLTISIAVTLSDNLDNPSVEEISHNCATMKSHLKKLKNSNYLIDRRKQKS